MSRWRARYFQIKLAPGLTLVVTARRFKTARANRSDKYHQLVITISESGIREIAFRLSRSKKGRRAPAKLLKSQALPLSVVIIGLCGLAVFGQQIVVGKQIEPVSFKSVGTPKRSDIIRTLARSLPLSLSIPSLEISADIIPVGQTASGVIAMPPLLATHTVGWYKLGPTPGQLGPAIIVGHVDNDTTTSIFWRLHLIKPDAIISVTLADGNVARFKVNKLAEVSQSNFPTDEVYGNINHPGLRLITCGGSFDQQTGSYTQNTVVYASLIN